MGEQAFEKAFEAAILGGDPSGAVGVAFGTALGGGDDDERVDRRAEAARVRKAPEARYAHKAAQGVKGSRLWRRGFERRVWHEDFMDPTLRERPESIIYREFRQRFRIPLPMFDEIVEELRATGLFPDEKKVKSGAKPIPLALKVMAAMRVAAVGLPFGCAESQGVSYDAVRDFFFPFVRWMRATVYSRHVRIPNAAEAALIEAVFAKCGFPGAYPRLRSRSPRPRPQQSLRPPFPIVFHFFCTLPAPRPPVPPPPTCGGTILYAPRHNTLYPTLNDSQTLTPKPSPPRPRARCHAKTRRCGGFARCCTQRLGRVPGKPTLVTLR